MLLASSVTVGQFGRMRASSLLCLVLMSACGVAAPTSDAGCPTATKSPPNLMINGGFECGGAAPAEWMGVNGTLSFVTTGATEGSRAAKVVSDASGTGGVGSTTPVVAKTSGKTYCINAKVKGTAPDVRLEVFGSLLTSFSSPLNSPDAWVRLPPPPNVGPPTNLEIREPADQALYVKVHAQGGAAGDTVIVDDIDLWESPNGKCDQVR